MKFKTHFRVFTLLIFASCLYNYMMVFNYNQPIAKLLCYLALAPAFVAVLYSQLCFVRNNHEKFITAISYTYSMYPRIMFLWLIEYFLLSALNFEPVSFKDPNAKALSVLALFESFLVIYMTVLVILSSVALLDNDDADEPFFTTVKHCYEFIKKYSWLICELHFYIFLWIIFIFLFFETFWKISMHLFHIPLSYNSASSIVIVFAILYFVPHVLNTFVYLYLIKRHHILPNYLGPIYYPHVD